MSALILPSCKGIERLDTVILQDLESHCSLPVQHTSAPHQTVADAEALLPPSYDHLAVPSKSKLYRAITHFMGAILVLCAIIEQMVEDGRETVVEKVVRNSMLDANRCRGRLKSLQLRHRVALRPS